MSAGRLYGPKENERVDKVRVTAQLSGVTIDYDDTFRFGIDNVSPDFLAKFPMGQTPGFEANDGDLLLTESNAIVLYLASLKESNPLLGATKEALAKIHQFNFFTETQVVPYVYAIVLPVWGYAPYSASVEKDSYQKLERGLDYLETQLKGKTYLVGDSLTVADIILAGGLSVAFAMILDETYRSKYPNVTRFYTNYCAIPKVKELIGEPALADKPLQFTPTN